MTNTETLRALVEEMRSFYDAEIEVEFKTLNGWIERGESLLTQSPVVPQGLTAEGISVDALAQIIREVDGNHQLGASRLAEAIVSRIAAAPAAPVAECPTCEKDGVWATDGAGPFDCYRCGKKAAPVVEVDEAVARDADRYRFLRNHANEVGSMSPAVILATEYFAVDSEETEGFVFGEDLDKAVDSALTAALGREGGGNG